MKINMISGYHHWQKTKTRKQGKVIYKCVKCGMFGVYKGDGILNISTSFYKLPDIYYCSGHKMDYTGRWVILTKKVKKRNNKYLKKGYKYRVEFNSVMRNTKKHITIRTKKGCVVLYKGEFKLLTFSNV